MKNRGNKKLITNIRSVCENRIPISANNTIIGILNGCSTMIAMIGTQSELGFGEKVFVMTGIETETAADQSQTSPERRPDFGNC